MKYSTVVSNVGVLTDNLMFSMGSSILSHMDLIFGKIKKTPVVINNEIVIKTVLPLALVWDHRIADGADIALFWNNFKSHFENTDKIFSCDDSMLEIP
jgi:pyruvate dehydrogenase E2 component (dihydrolipoamide acetyltransferase)